MLIDDWQAKAQHMDVGSTYTLLSQDWHGGGNRGARQSGTHFVPISTLQETVGAREKASIFLVNDAAGTHQRRDGRDEIEFSGLPGAAAERLHVADEVDEPAGTCRHSSTRL